MTALPPLPAVAAAVMVFFCLCFPSMGKVDQTSKADGGVQLWCVAKNNAEDMALQTALDWACGSSGGGVDCGPVQQGGSCFQPDDLQFHASYAFNEYYIRHPQQSDSCYFAGTAALSQLDPTKSMDNVSPNCKFPSIVNGSIGGSVSGSGLGPVASDRSAAAHNFQAHWDLWTLVMGLLIGCTTAFPWFSS